MANVKWRPAFDSTAQKDVGGTAALIFVVPTGLAARLGPNVDIQGDRLLIQTDHGFARIVRPFIDFQNVFHFGDIVLN